MEQSAEYIEGYKAAEQNDKFIHRQEQTNNMLSWDENLIISPYPSGTQHDDWCRGYSDKIKEIYPDIKGNGTLC